MPETVTLTGGYTFTACEHVDFDPTCMICALMMMRLSDVLCCEEWPPYPVPTLDSNGCTHERLDIDCPICEAHLLVYSGTLPDTN